MMAENYKVYRKIGKGLLLFLIIIFILPIFLRLSQESFYFFNRKLMPAIWCGFIASVVLFVPKLHPLTKLSKRETLYAEAVVCSIIFIVVKILVASVLGQLGGSPYNLTPRGILGNLYFILPSLASKEIVRSYFLGAYCRKKNLKIFILITIIMTALSLNYTKLIIGDMEAMAIFISEEIGPKLSINIMLSYLALYGGATAPILYIGIQEIFHWVSPILSSLNWLAEGAVGILVPVATMMFILDKYEGKKIRFASEKSHKKGNVGWLATAIFSIGLLWFIAGVFPVLPSVIVTGSMEPIMYPGDLIILRQMQTEEQIRNLEEGDVIQFQRGEIRITHRIVEIVDDGIGNLSFRTKGDNNSTEDANLVEPNHVKGALIKVIPKVGYPSLLVKSAGRKTRTDLEF